MKMEDSDFFISSEVTIYEAQSKFQEMLCIKVLNPSWRR